MTSRPLANSDVAEILRLLSIDTPPEMKSHGIESTEGAVVDLTLHELPCARRVTPTTSCPNKGKFLCSSCRLVAYCCMDCQKKDWKEHKAACKSEMRVPGWLPAWEVFLHEPEWNSASEWPAQLVEEPKKNGLELWSTFPAYDVLNITDNEGTAKDFDIAFPASGDLRNVIRTVNELPSSYSGSLNITLGDRDPHIVIRNLLILALLGKPDMSRCVDTALHIWYSSVIPISYGLEAALMLKSLMTNNQSAPYKVTKTSTILGGRTFALSKFASEFHRNMHEAAETMLNMANVSLSLSRIDYQDMEYAKLEPSHRVALHKYKSTGILVPFGTTPVRFDYTNKYLFSPEGKWLQNGMANPLYSWDINAVVESGKARGVPREDLYGCLYFHLSSQLTEFASRLRRFKITFKLYHGDASALAKAISSPAGLPGLQLGKKTRFDRIDTGNLIDEEYLGLKKVLTEWGPLLKEKKNNDKATLIATSLNWAARVGGAAPTRSEAEALMKKLVKDGRIPGPPSGPNASMEQRAAYTAKLPAFRGSVTSVYDNSPAFAKYLRSQGLEDAMRSSKLKRKQRHTVVPHRLYAPLDATSSALPEFKDNEDWYLKTSPTGIRWTERFLEFTRG